MSESNHTCYSMPAKTLRRRITPCKDQTIMMVTTRIFRLLEKNMVKLDRIAYYFLGKIF